MPFWDDVMHEVADDYPDIEHDEILIDAMVARVLTRPDSLDVIVASNLFGDILSDLTAAAVGGLGTAPSANLDPSRTSPSLFQASTARPRTSRARASPTPSPRCCRWR